MLKIGDLCLVVRGECMGKKAIILGATETFFVVKYEDGEKGSLLRQHEPLSLWRRKPYVTKVKNEDDVLREKYGRSLMRANAMLCSEERMYQKEARRHSQTSSEAIKEITEAGGLVEDNQNYRRAKLKQRKLKRNPDF